MAYFNTKTACQHGHTHASRKEAKRCNDLHIRQRAGEISGLEVEPIYTFPINGKPVKMANGHEMKFTPDFAYVEAGRKVVEDVKAANAHMARDVPVKLALARHLWPDVTWKIVS